MTLNVLNSKLLSPIISSDSSYIINIAKLRKKKIRKSAASSIPLYLLYFYPSLNIGYISLCLLSFLFLIFPSSSRNFYSLANFLGSRQFKTAINFLTFRFPVGNLGTINQNQKTSWDCNSCFTHSIYMKWKGNVNLNLLLSL